MAINGKILKKNIVEDKVFDIGIDYAKSLDPAIKKNEEWKKSFDALKQSALSYAELSKKFLKVENNATFIKSKKQEVQLYEQTTIALKEQRRIEKNLITTKERLKLAGKSTNQQLIKERAQLQLLNREIKRSKLEQLGVIGAYDKLNKKRTDAQKHLQNLLSAEKQNETQIKKAQKEYAKLNKRVLAVDKATNNYTKNIGNYKSAMKGLSGIARNLAGALGAVGGAYAVISVFKNGIRIIKDFDASMQNLAGITRINRKELAGLEQKIIDVSSTSIKTATDVAKLAEELVTLGKTPQQVEKLLKPVNDLSIGLNTASDEAGLFLVQMLNTFGASEDQAQEYADTIATIRTSTSLDFQKMRDSFQYLAPISKILNKDLAYTGAVVGILSDNGLKAEKSGRLLATAQQKLASKGLTLNDALEKINDATAKGIEGTDLLAIATDLFGVQGAKVGIVLANNSDLIEKNTEKIRGNKGALDTLVNEQLKSLSAHLDILKSKWETYILNTDKASGASNQLKKGIKFLSDNLERILNTIITVVKAFVIYKAVIIATSVVSKAYTSVVTALRIAKIALAGGIGKATRKLKLFNAVTKLSPLGVFLTVLSGAIALFSAFRIGASASASAQRQLNKAFEDGKKSAGDYNDAISKSLKEQFTLIDQNKKERLLQVQGEVAENKVIVQSINEKIEAVKKEREAVKNRVIAYSKMIQTTGQSNVVEAKHKGLIKEESNTYDKLTSQLKDLNISKKQILKTDKESAKLKRKEISQAQKDLNKKIANDKYQLNKFLLEQEIKLQDDLSKNEEEAGIERLIAIDIRYKKEVELAKLRREHLLEQENLTKEGKKLIQEKYNQERKTAFDNKENSKDDLDLNLLQRKNEKEKNLREKALNDRLKGENDFYKEILKQGFDNDAERERAVEAHEKRIATIKKDYAVQGLNAQLDALNELIKQTKKGSDLRVEYEAKASKLKKQISDIEVADFIEKEDTKLEKVKLTTEDILSISQELTYAIQDLANALYDRKIQLIDDELERENQKYEKAIQLAGDDVVKKELLENEHQKKVEILEKKKRKEQRKQAKLNKAMAIVQATINTALAISSALTQAPPAGYIFAALSAVLGAVQIAAIASQPIPAYAKGTQNHIGGLALVGEERAEVIQEPNKAPYIVSKPSILDLPQGTKVTPSIDEYNSLMNNNLMDSILLNRLSISEQITSKDAELLEEMKGIRKELKKQKPIYIKTPDIDIEHLLWVKNNEF